VELVRRKAYAGHELTAEARVLFNANTKRLDELQADQFKEAKAKGTPIPVIR
jgi:hypothetical protein